MSEKFYSPWDASERILASGRPLSPGEFVELTDEEMKDPHNKRLLAEGNLLQIVKVEQSLESLQNQAKLLEIEGRSKMSKPQLERAIQEHNERLAEEATARREAQEGNQ